MSIISNITDRLQREVKGSLTKKGSLNYRYLQETVRDHVYLYGPKATIHKMVEAMSRDEADYLLYLILEHGDFDERE